MSLPARWRLQVHESLPSTQGLALELAERGEAGGLAILAHRQTEGRGRAGRPWQSRPGNLLLSVLLRPAGPAREIAGHALLAAVAVHEAALRHVPERALRLKWPNDLMEGDAKLAGILAEAALDPAGGIAHLVLGFGVNLAHAPEVEGRAVGRLGPIPAEEFCATLLGRLAYWHDIRLERGFSPIREAWEERGPPRGTVLTLQQGDNAAIGSYEGLAEDGGLRLATAEGPRIFHAGEVIGDGHASRG